MVNKVILLWFKEGLFYLNKTDKYHTKLYAEPMMKQYLCKHIRNRKSGHFFFA
jgi:hypothetical protein